MRPTAQDNARIMALTTDPLRAHLVRLLDWEEAHVSFDKSVDGIPADRRGTIVEGVEHSPWQLVEHIRLAQNDLLAFAIDPQYVHEMNWPEDYWPNPMPPSGEAWEASLTAFRRDRERLKELIADDRVDLFATVPTGKGPQTYLRAILLVADHNAYHVGQLVVVRRALGLWG